MIFGKLSLLSIAALCCTGNTIALPESREASLAPQKPTVLQQFPKGYEPENLLQRENGQLVITMNTPPAVYQVDPESGETRSIYNFTQTTAGGGILELEKDVFLVAMGNASASTSTGTLKTWALHKVDLRKYVAPSFNPSEVVVSKVVSIPDARVVDGMAWINKGKGLIATADFVTGTIRLVDIQKKTTSVVSDSPLLKGELNKLFPGAPIGVNGLKFRKSAIHFTTTTTGIYGKVPVDITTGKSTGPAQTIFNFTKSVTFDDFNFAKNGDVFLSTLVTPKGGFLRRPSGTPIGKNDTTLVISAYGANAIVLDGAGKNCRIYNCNSIKGRVETALLSDQPC